MLQLRGISGCRLMVALVFTPPSPLHFHAHRPPTPSKAWNRPWNSGHPSLGILSLVRTQLRHPCAQRDQTTKRPSSVRSISIRAWLVARDYLAAGSGHPRVAVHKEGGGGRYVSQVIFDISLVCAKGVRGRSMLGIWIIRLPGWSQVVQMVHIAVVWPCCPCPSTAQCPATSST